MKNQTQRQKEENEIVEDMTKKSEKMVETVQDSARNSSFLFRYFFYILASLFLVVLFIFLILKNTFLFRFHNYRSSFIQIKTADKLIRKMLNLK
jgi:hypothetical protein